MLEDDGEIERVCVTEPVCETVPRVVTELLIDRVTVCDDERDCEEVTDPVAKADCVLDIDIDVESVDLREAATDAEGDTDCDSELVCDKDNVFDVEIVSTADDDIESDTPVVTDVDGLDEWVPLSEPNNDGEVVTDVEYVGLLDCVSVPELEFLTDAERDTECVFVSEPVRLAETHSVFDTVSDAVVDPEREIVPLGDIVTVLDADTEPQLDDDIVNV